MRKLSHLLRRFRRDQRGVLMAEGLITLPLLLWAYLALFVYWDAYRAINSAQKAAYTLSDMISREMNTTPMTPSYITGMRNLMQYLIGNSQVVSLRVTSVTYSSARGRFEVDWSVSPSSALAALTTGTLAAVKDRIPMMADGDHAIIVETKVPYQPAFDVGLSDTVLEQFVVTRPRFAPKLCMSGFSCS
jgi:Flp pilus assembly protein TadG